MEHLHNIRLPAGWYPDPDGADHRRWWDGTTWTQHTAPFQRPVVVYEVDDLAEYRAHAKAKGAALDAAEAEKASTVPAPRRIRTAARLGRSLAALAHKLPFGLPSADDPAEKPASDAGASEPAPVTSERQIAKAAAAAAAKSAAKKPATKKPSPKKAAEKPSVKKPAEKKPTEKQPTEKPAATRAATKPSSKKPPSAKATPSTDAASEAKPTAAQPPKSGAEKSTPAQQPAAKKPTTRSNPLTGAITPRSPGRHVR